MTGRALPRSRLGHLIPALLESQTLVALVPATGDLEWAARAAWDVARAAAQTDRRVALVDLWLEQPALQNVVGIAPSEGIVDAFEYGVSLTKTAHERDKVFFIASGAATVHPTELLSHERWRKLQRGFQSEGALLLLFLPHAALDTLAAVPDGLIPLSPDGFEPGLRGFEGIPRALERGVPILGIVRERWTPAPGMARVSAATRAPRRSVALPVALVATLGIVAAGGWQLLAKDAGPAHDGAKTLPRAVAVRPMAPASPARRDTVAWTIQVAAFGALPAALGLADRFNSAGSAAFVTPVSSGRGTVWYRVAVGAYPSREAAATARDALWGDGRVTRGEGDLLEAPYSLQVPAGVTPDSLRRLGIPAVRSWAGAFESPEQAGLAESLLERAGLHAILVTRTEFTP